MKTKEQLRKRYKIVIHEDLYRIRRRWFGVFWPFIGKPVSWSWALDIEPFDIETLEDARELIDLWIEEEYAMQSGAWRFVE